MERTEVSDSACSGDADSERELTPEVVDAESTPLTELPAAALMRPCASRFWTVTDLRISVPLLDLSDSSAPVVVVMTGVCLVA